MRFKDLREQQKKPKVQTKEVKLKPNIAEGDIKIKLDMIKRFLEEGHRVKISMTFRGRENAFREFGMQKINSIVESVKNISSISSPLKFNGNNVLIILAGKKK